MELASVLKSSILAALLCAVVPFARAQMPPANEPPPLTIGEIRVEQAKLPGSKLTWTKIVIGFDTTQTWTDGIMFNVHALLDERGQQRLISGVVRYGNVPKGPQTAVFYISPRATARFGKPIAVKVDAFYKDREAGSKRWTDGRSSVPQDWTSLNLYPGILLNVVQTPWLLLDYEQSPDVIVNQ